MKEPPQVEEVVAKTDFDRIVVKAREVWSRLPELDYDALHKELSSLNVPVSDTPSLQKISADILRIQAALSRAGQIKMMADKDYVTKSAIVKVLASGWIKFSTETSMDRRKAEAEVKMYQFYEALTEAEVLHNAATAVIQNLMAKYESVSRLVSIFQLQVKMLDTGANRVLPDAEEKNSGDFDAGNSHEVVESEGASQKYEGWPESP